MKKVRTNGQVGISPFTDCWKLKTFSVKGHALWPLAAHNKKDTTALYKIVVLIYYVDDCVATLQICFYTKEIMRGTSERLRGSKGESYYVTRMREGLMYGKRVEG
jgi:hypothetical protein